MFRDQPSGPHLLARWSFHTPRQEIGQASRRAAAAGMTSVRGGCRLALGHELHGRGLLMVWA